MPTDLWPYPRVIAHRGGGTLAPENTLAAMRCGYEHGFRGVEFDVMLSSDGVPVLMHDPSFGRTVRGVGRISDTSAEDIDRLDAGTSHSPRFAGEPVPRLAALIDWCRARSVWMNIEIKPAHPDVADATGAVTARVVAERFADAIAAANGRLDPALPLLSSFSDRALIAARAACPGVPRALLVGTVPRDWRERLHAVGGSALHARHAGLDAATVRAVRDSGVPMLAYTVDAVDRARKLLGWGVDALCTDRLDRITAEFAAGFAADFAGEGTSHRTGSRNGDVP